MFSFRSKQSKSGLPDINPHYVNISSNGDDVAMEVPQALSLVRAQKSMKLVKKGVSSKHRKMSKRDSGILHPGILSHNDGIATASTCYQFDTMSFAPIPQKFRSLLSKEFIAKLDAGGKWISVTDNNPAVCADWASFSLITQFYRVRSVTIEFMPYGMYVSDAQLPLAVISDWQDAVPLSAFSGTANTSVDEHPDTVSFGMANAPWRHTLVLPDLYPWNVWTPVATPVANAWIKTYADGGTALADMGRIILFFDLEFLSRD